MSCSSTILPFTAAIKAWWGAPPGLGGASNMSQWEDMTTIILEYALLYGNSVPVPVNVQVFPDDAFNIGKVLFVKWCQYYYYDNGVYHVGQPGVAIIPEGGTFTLPPCPPGSYRAPTH